MFCSKCGAEIPDGAQWCPKCGAQQGATVQNLEQNPSQAVNAQPQSAPGAVSGFILSLAGLLLDWTPIVGLALSIVGLVLCSKGKKEVADRPALYTNTGLLSAGYIIGIIGIVGGVCVLILALISVLILGGSFFSILDFAKDMAALSY